MSLHLPKMFHGFPGRLEEQPDIFGLQRNAYQVNSRSSLQCYDGHLRVVGSFFSPNMSISEPGLPQGFLNAVTLISASGDYLLLWLRSQLQHPLTAQSQELTIIPSSPSTVPSAYHGLVFSL